MVVGSKEEEDIKKKLRNEMDEYKGKIIIINKQIEEIDKLIIKKCTHDFERQRDPGLYGESYLVCKNCLYEY